MWEKMYTLGLKFLSMETNAGTIYSIQRNYSSEEIPDEMAHINVGVNNGVVFIKDLHVYKNTPCYKGYENSHMGTNMLSDVFADIWFRKNIKYKIITGKLSRADAHNKNWINSISFYRDFPKYLNPNLPFDLKFTLLKPEGEKTGAIIKDDVSPKEIVALYGDKVLKFQYDLIPK